MVAVRPDRAPVGARRRRAARHVIGAFASDEVRWGETIVSASLTTAFCIGLFKFALGLPIPLAPWLLGY